MCTVTLRCDGGSLLLTMNRDERWDRAPEEAPRIIPGAPGRPSWLAPFDSASGGTWIGVNDRGVAACVLNGYGPADEALRGNPGVPSRGSIIPRILEEQDGAGRPRVHGVVDFSAYASFTLLVASKDGGEVVRWRHGGGLEREEVGLGWTLLTSSSWDEPEVAASRRRVFDDWRASGEPMLAGVPSLHVVTSPGEEPRAPFMTRAQSATRSVTQIHVDPARAVATLAWWPRSGSSAVDPASPAARLALPIGVPQGPVKERRLS